MSRFSGKLSACMLMCLFCLSAFPILEGSAWAGGISKGGQTGDLDIKNLPKELKPWVDWARYGHEKNPCPTLYNNGTERICRWPSALTLSLEEQGGSFSQKILIFKEGWVILPGNGKAWPQQVRVDGRTTAVIKKAERPMILLQPGSHTVSGKLLWERLPQSLAVPKDTGLIQLKVSGSKVAFPDVDSEGVLWLRGRKTVDTRAEDVLGVQVYRRLDDGNPMAMLTRIELSVSGKHREVLLGRVLMDRFVPISLNSPLPARLEPDGRLRMQVRPGQWNIELKARRMDYVESLKLEKGEGAWAEEEIWAFESRNKLRLVTVEGPVSIDPQQTGLPEDWRMLPAYRMLPGTEMTFKVKRRGNPDPPPDQLSLERRFWLDFDGEGMSLRDIIRGTINRGWRLEMDEPAVLGRVSVDGQDQFITRREGGLSGVEVRKGSIQLEADSRIEKTEAEWPIVGWHHDFQSLSATLHLPPGWSVFDVWGVDTVSGAWLRNWTLLDLFIVLLAAVAVGRLYGRKWGVLAGVMFVMIYRESGSPTVIWLFVLAAEALLRVLPEGKLQKLTRMARWAFLLSLIVTALPFAVQQVRQGIYPQLENPWKKMAGDFTLASRSAAPPAMFKANMEYKDAEEAMMPESGKSEIQLEGMLRQAMDQADISAGEMVQQSNRGYGADKAGWHSRKKQQKLILREMNQYDPSIINQTGPGLPDWEWDSVRLTWSGPVDREQKIRAILISPKVNLVLAFLRVLLLLLVVVRVFKIGNSGKGFRNKDLSSGVGDWQQKGAMTLLCLFLLIGYSISGAERQANAETPDKWLLDELERRLVHEDEKIPECQPNCAAIPRADIEIARDRLTLRLEIHGQMDTAIPLPGQAQHWLPDRVLVDGVESKGLIRRNGGVLWMQLKKGVHRILLSGALPSRDSFQLPMALKPALVKIHAPDFEVEGLHENGLVDELLQFTRKRSEDEGKGEELEPGHMPPFVEVERRVLIGQKWYLQTEVRRLGPSGSAVVLEIPLLEGESVTDEDVRVENKRVLVNMGGGERSFEWNSTFEKRPLIELSAPAGVPWVEVWKLDASAIWHVETEGIAAIHHTDERNMRLPAWRPWPGEKVKIAVSRPGGVEGQTLTIDSSRLELKPGRRSSETKLSLVMRSNRGGQHRLTLPEGAQLLSVLIGGKEQPIRQEKRAVNLPLTPGSQHIELKWRESVGMEMMYHTPSVELGQESVNATMELRVPRDRWILFAGGPDMGPAVLFWGMVIVTFLLSIVLGRVDLTPLKWYHWFLLGLGLVQAEMLIAVPVALWLLALGYRRQLGETTPKYAFDFYQLVLVNMTLAALVCLGYAISRGLLDHPDMQIAGNGSMSYLLRWYQDRSTAMLPQAWMISAPMWVYRVLMLIWALWLAVAMLSWVKWGWESFSGHTYWKALEWRIPRPKKNKKEKEAAATEEPVPSPGEEAEAPALEKDDAYRALVDAAKSSKGEEHKE